MTERRRKRGGWGSTLSWLIFLLAIGGGPLLRGLQGALGSTVPLASYMPYIVGGLVLLSLALPALRALGGRRPPNPMDSLPERMGPGGAANEPMPSFGGDRAPEPGARPVVMPSPMPMIGAEVLIPRVPDAPPPTPRAEEAPPIRTPQFDPLVPPGVLALGVLGLLVLGGLALVLLGAVTP